MVGFYSLPNNKNREWEFVCQALDASSRGIPQVVVGGANADLLTVRSVRDSDALAIVTGLGLQDIPPQYQNWSYF